MNKILEGMMQKEVVELIADAITLIDKNTLQKVCGMVESELMQRTFDEKDGF